MRWYNPKTGSSETVAAPRSDQEAERMLGGAVDSRAFVAEYERLRGDGMGIEQALIFVGHCFRMRHLSYLSLGQPAG